MTSNAATITLCQPMKYAVQTEIVCKQIKVKYAAMNLTLNAATHGRITAAIKRKCQWMKNAATPQILNAAKLAKTTVAGAKNLMMQLINAAATE